MVQKYSGKATSPKKKRKIKEETRTKNDADSASIHNYVGLSGRMHIEERRTRLLQ